MASTLNENEPRLTGNAANSGADLREADEIDGAKTKHKATKRRRRRGRKRRGENAALGENREGATVEDTFSVRNKSLSSNPDDALSVGSGDQHEKRGSEQQETAEAKATLDMKEPAKKHNTGQITGEDVDEGSAGKHQPNTPARSTSREETHTPGNVSNQQSLPNHSKQIQNQFSSKGQNSPQGPSTPESHNTPKHGRKFRGKMPRQGQNNPSMSPTKKHPQKQVPPSHQNTPNTHQGGQNNTPSSHQSDQNTPTNHGQQGSPQTPISPGSENTGQHRSHSSKKKKHKKKKMYEEYWSKEKVSAALKRGEIFQGSLRINPKSYEMAWVTLKGFKRDISILGMLLRNRALEGDVVAVEILPKEDWKIMSEEMRFNEDAVEEAAEALTSLQLTSKEEDNSAKNGVPPKSPTKKQKLDVHEVPDEYLQRTAKVVYIIEKKHTRIACGYLRPMTDVNDPDGLFSPTDSRLPRIRIARNDCPPRFFERPQDFATTLMIARLMEWHREAPLDSFLALGVFAKSLGEAGDIEPETDSILLVNDIDTSPFTEEVLDCLPKDLPWKIPQEELDSRRDFRDVCVFTIDPATARDLDDALHCDVLEDGSFEIGVHIADVSFFVKEATALDEMASGRATSTYMVQKVIPMLPRLLCEELCSLNPNQDRLSFSVVWRMDGDGVIQDEWMGKGVIRSRVKLSYEHAQEMIDHPDKVWSEDEHPPLASGTGIGDIVERVRNLHKIAAKLRRKRFENGTLRLDKAKVCFDLDAETGLPIGWHPYAQRESNKLIEEYMLLANMAVAHRIYNAFPDRAMLRCHPKPDARQLEDVRATCSSLGINFMYDSSKGIQETLNTFPLHSPEHLVLSHLSMKPMKAAKYFCAATAEGDPEEFLHYALSVPLYTHFTSPIRRYPDVIVHRLLGASLEVEPTPAFTSEDLDAIAGRCNDKKLAAKKAGEASVELYLGVFVRECGPLVEDGIVVNVMHESVDVLVPDFGIIKRVYYKFCDEVKSFEFQEGHKTHPAEVLITWKGPRDKRNSHGETSKEEDSSNQHRRSQRLTIFTRVRVLLRTEDDKAKNKGGVKFCGEVLPNVPKE